MVLPDASYASFGALALGHFSPDFKSSCWLELNGVRAAVRARRSEVFVANVALAEFQGLAAIKSTYGLSGSDLGCPILLCKPQTSLAWWSKLASAVPQLLRMSVFPAANLWDSGLRRS